MSKELISSLQLHKLKIREHHCFDTFSWSNRREVEEKNIFPFALGNSKSRTENQKKVAQVEVGKFLSEISTDSLVIFTDGSVKGELSYGRGGCGVVMYKKGEEENIIVESHNVGTVTENVQCEVVGIVKALELAVEKFESQPSSIKNCYILTDCKSAVDIVCKQNNVSKYWNEFLRMWEMMDKLQEGDVKLVIVWVPGHADISYNDEADKAAKLGTERNVSIEGDEEVTSSAVIYWIKEKIKKEWKRMWERSETGEWTKDLGFKAAEKRKFPGQRDLDVSYVRAVINNTGLSDNMFKFNLAEDCNCSCGKDRETLEHVLLECELEDEARDQYKEKVKNFWMNKKCDGGLNIDATLILAPFSINKLSSSDADQMLKLSFEFISKLSKKF